MLLLAVGLAFRPRLRIPRTYYPLAGAITFLALVAVSPWVRTGTGVIDLSFLVPDPVVNLYAIHRATVRLAWPLVISLSLLALANFVLAWPRRLAVPLLTTALALQIFSIWPYWTYEHQDARATVTRLAPPPRIVEGATHLQFRSDAGQSPITPLHLYQAMQLAVDSGVPLEEGRFARQPPTNRDTDDSAPDFEGSARVRYWAAAPPPSGDLAESLLRLPHLECVKWEALLVCQRME